MKDDSDWIIIGRFGSPHGLKGYVSVYSFTDPEQNIINYHQWYVSINGQWTQLKVLDTEEHNRFIIALIEGYQDRDKASHLRNLDIAIPSEHLPVLAQGEYYWRQLIGMTVINTNNAVLGLVTEMMATGSNDVLVVVGEKRYLIPYRFGTVVLNVCENKRQITVDWDGDYL